MRINQQNKTLDIEVRDINYILPAYIRSYLFHTRNEDPEKIVFPMFSAVPHPNKAGVMIPIEWIPMIDPAAIEITQNGSNIAEVTPAQEAAIDEKDEEIRQLKARLSEMELNARPVDCLDLHQAGTSAKLGDTRVKDGVPELYGKAGKDIIVGSPEQIRPPASKSKSKATPLKTEPPAGRVPKMPPGGDIGVGSPDNMGSRDRRDLARAKQDLKDEPETDETAEAPFDKTVERDEKGNPIVKE